MMVIDSGGNLPQLAISPDIYIQIQYYYKTLTADPDWPSLWLEKSSPSWHQITTHLHLAPHTYPPTLPILINSHSRLTGAWELTKLLQTLASKLSTSFGNKNHVIYSDLQKNITHRKHPLKCGLKFYCFFSFTKSVYDKKYMFYNIS